MNKNIIYIAVLACALLFSLVLGSNIASSDFESLSIYAVVAIVVYFIINGWRNVWWFTALLIFSGVVFVQGFVFNVEHLFILMVLLATILSLVQGDVPRKSILMRRAGGRKLSFLITILLVYGAIHFGYNLADPISANEYSVKTSTKAYFECFASMTALLWILIGSFQFRMKENWSTLLVLIIVASLFGNVIAKAFLYAAGIGSDLDSLGGGGSQFASSGVVVPVINMQAGVYTLRNLPPIAIVILGMLITAPGYFRDQKLIMKYLLILGVFLAIVGAIMGGGRATFPFCVGLLITVAMVRRRFNYVILTGMVGIILVIITNIFSKSINENAPYYVARSLQTVMIEKGRAYETISGSQDVRNDAFAAAIQEWKSDPRRMIFGRSVLYTSTEDILYLQKNYKDGFVRTTLRSGRTHNLVSDLLLQYGIVGFALYISCYFGVAIYAVKLFRAIPGELRVVKALSGAIAVYLPFIIVYHLIGGNFLPMVVVLVMGICRSQLSRYEEGVLRSQAESVSQSATGRPTDGSRSLV
jgi:hypothetical protein